MFGVISVMPVLYAAFFPALSPDADWIYQFREDHDPKSGVVAPHLTLVFPTSLLVADQFVKAVRDACNGLKSFDAEFRAAVFMPERVGQISKASVFLVPDRGFSDIVWLHSKLYSGSLAAAQLFEFPFIPHTTYHNWKWAGAS